MEYQTTLLSSPADLPQPPRADRLGISGLSVIFYCAHRVEPSSISEAISRGQLRAFTDDRSYAEKLRSGSPLFYSAPVEGGEFPAALSRQLQSGHAPDLRQSILWLGDDYIISVMPIVLSVTGNSKHTVHLSSPLSIDQVINFLGALSGGAEARRLAEQAAASLVELGILAAQDIIESWPMRGYFGIQVWNLGGTSGRSLSDLYLGVAESISYAWEISALLSFNADHLIEGGLWLRRSPRQVYNDIRTGFSFFDDHMVFLNADCCIEMAHLPAWLRGRSEYRLANYGYDSSSLYVWSIGLLQTAIVDDLSRRYRELSAQFINLDGMDASEHARFTQAQMRDTGLIDRLTGLRESLVEARNRAFYEQQGIERSSDRSVLVLRQEIAKAAALADGLARAREESSRHRRDSILAIVGVALAASQIPSFVSQVDNWATVSDWAPFIASNSLILVSIVIVLLLWRRRRS